MTDTTREGVIMRDALQKIANSDRHARCREIAWQALAALRPAQDAEGWVMYLRQAVEEFERHHDGEPRVDGDSADEIYSWALNLTWGDVRAILAASPLRSGESK